MSQMNHPVARAAEETLRNGIDIAQSAAAPALVRVAEQANALLSRGTEAVREGSTQLREGVHRASDSTVEYIRNEPVKAVLIAAAGGAALMALTRLIGRRERH